LLNHASRCRPTLKRRSRFGEVPFPSDIFPNNSVPVRRKAQRGNGGNSEGRQRVRARRFSPAPISDLPRLAIRNTRIYVNSSFLFTSCLIDATIDRQVMDQRSRFCLVGFILVTRTANISETNAPIRRRLQGRGCSSLQINVEQKGMDLSCRPFPWSASLCARSIRRFRARAREKSPA